MQKVAAQIADTVLLKLAQGEEESSRWWLPLVAAGLLGGGAYGLARHAFKGPKGSALAKIREMSGGRMVRGDLPTVYDPQAPWHKRLIRKLKYGPEIDPDDPAQVAAYLKGKKPGETPAIWTGDELAPKGAFNPALGPGTRKQRMKALDIVDDMDDKLLEAELLQKYAPGTIAKTHGLQDFLEAQGLKLRRGKNFESDLKTLQNALNKEFGGKYIVKTRQGGVASSGAFPTESTDLFKAHQQWRAMLPEYKAAIKEHRKLMGEAPLNPVYEKFRRQPGYEGRIVDEMLKDNVILQERLPLQQFGPRVSKYMKSKGYAPTREFRIHVVGGKAIPQMAMPRYPTPAALVDYIRARRAARWAQKNVLDKLPKEYQGLSMGMDVAPLQGKGGYRVIETNVGGSSGLLDSPLASHQLHKAVTGRYSRPAAAMIGGGAALGGAGLGGAVNALIPKGEPPRPLPANRHSGSVPV